MFKLLATTFFSFPYRYDQNLALENLLVRRYDETTLRLGKLRVKGGFTLASRVQKRRGVQPRREGSIMYVRAYLSSIQHKDLTFTLVPRFISNDLE